MQTQFNFIINILFIAFKPILIVKLLVGLNEIASYSLLTHIIKSLHVYTLLYLGFHITHKIQHVINLSQVTYKQKSNMQLILTGAYLLEKKKKNTQNKQTKQSRQTIKLSLFHNRFTNI